MHAHKYTYSRDCDGPMESSYDIWPDDDESEFDFRYRVTQSMVSFPYDGPGYHFEMRITADDKGFIVRINQSHEEGGSSAEVRFCEDDCEPADYSQRDHYAEAMNY